MKRRAWRLLVGSLCGAVGLLVGALPASAVTNSDFEDDEVDAAPAGWTIVDQRIDLGVSTIAGCKTVDTSSYGNLRNFAEYAFPEWSRKDEDENDYPSHPIMGDYIEVRLRVRPRKHSWAASPSGTTAIVAPSARTCGSVR